MVKGSDTTVSVKRVQAGDVYVRVSSIGDKGVRPFVLVPGIGVASNYFERLAPNLNEFGPVYAVDLPGFAGVPHPEDAMTIRQYADLVGKVIDELELVDPVIVGHSMGTQVVTDLVARRPEISTVVLIGPVINPAERVLLKQGLRFAQAAVHEPGRVKALAFSAYLFCGVKWFSRILPKMMTFPMERALPHVKADTLVIRGEFDAVAPSDWVRRVGELLPSSRLWEIPGAAHSVMYAHAEEVAKLCVEHAEQPIEYDEGGVLRVFRHEGEGEAGEMFDPSAADVVASVRGRVRESIGMVTGDDDLIAEGKTEHGEAMQRAHARAEGEHEAEDGAKDAAGAGEPA